MKGYRGDIEKDTLENGNFRKVLYTGKHSQLVLMSLRPGEEIGMEVHLDNDQFFRFEKGEGKCIIDGNEYEVGDGVAILVPAGAEHNIIKCIRLGRIEVIYDLFTSASQRPNCACNQRRSCGE